MIGLVHMLSLEVSLPTTNSSALDHHIRQFTIGPQLGGLNFPGECSGLGL